MGSDRMFDREQRHRIIDTVMTPAAQKIYREGLDQAYSPDLFERVGLHRDGSAPAGFTFIERLFPVHTTVTAYGKDSASVEMWCLGTIGLDGKDSPRPMDTSWRTVTHELKWIDGTWKLARSDGWKGPEPADR